MIGLIIEEIDNIFGMRIVPSPIEQLSCLATSYLMKKSLVNCFEPTVEEREFMEKCPYCM